jgi:tryptophan 2,3-dioxygenase
MESIDSFVKPGRKSLSYDSYLRVSELTNLQTVQSSPPEHDETLFIIIHQVYELWFKQILHELELCCSELRRDFLIRVMHALKRINTIQKVLLQQIDVLETMIPDDFARFRGGINPASGFQSWQFRLVEFRMGGKEKNYLKFFAHDPKVTKILEDALALPSLYDEFLGLLKRRGFPIPRDVLERQPSEPYIAHPSVTEVFKTVYRNPTQHSEIYLALEAMLDLDEHFLLWRYRHVMMVERMIGNLSGTGGSTGAKYLRSTLDRRFFPEIWDVRNHLGTNYGGPR